MDLSSTDSTLAAQSKPSPLPQSLQRRLLHVLKPLALLTTFTKPKPKILQPSNLLSQLPTPPTSPRSAQPSSYSRHQRTTASISLSSIGVDEFLSIYGLESVGSRLRRMGFLEFESLRRANPYHLKRPGGSSSSSRSRQGPSSPSSRRNPQLQPLSRVRSPSLEGLTEQEIAELFVALRMWDEEMGPEGEDLRSYLATKAERSSVQVFRKVVSRRRSGSSTGA